MNKGQILEMITSLPNNINENDVIENLLFKAHVDAGLTALKEGKITSHEEMLKRYKLHV